MTFNRSGLGNLYKRESDPNVKERLLLVLKVEVDGKIPAHVAEELHRSRTWASDWLARYDKEGVNGLKNRPKSGRPPKLPQEIALKIKRKLIESKQRWSTKQVQDIIIKESRGEVKYHYVYIYRLLHKWWVSNRRYQEKYMSTQLQKKRKDSSKKSTGNTRQFT